MLRPKYVIPKKSGVHRAACFALYRALLRQKHALQLNEHQQQLFRKPIRSVFKRNSKLQSPPHICTALQLGYETLEGLHDGVRQKRILECLFELAAERRPNARFEEPAPSPRIKNVPAQKAAKIPAVPYPGAAHILDRPFRNLSGRRRIPILVNANRVPMLRIKKPQPPFLSRIIRDKVKVREHRLLGAERLASELSNAESEDEWDHNLSEHMALDLENTSEMPWQYEIMQSMDQNNHLQVKAIRKRVDLSAKMYAITMQEKALAREEKLRIRDQKHKARKARRLARRGLTESEIQERLSLQTEKTVTHDSPTTTVEVVTQGQGDVQRPFKGEERRKRGDKMKTKEELKQLREASLLPKTDDEIAKIKEARAKRKEEKAEKQARKRKRQEEQSGEEAEKLERNRGTAARVDQRVHKQGNDPTHKRLSADQEANLYERAFFLKLPVQHVGRRTGRRLLEKPREASGPRPDTPVRVVETGTQNLGVLRQSLFSPKKTQKRDNH